MTAIRNRWDGGVIYDVPDAADLGEAVRRAVAAGIDLAGANLSGANLKCADLSGANLVDTFLTRATLTRANLVGANLARAYLFRANLSDANLTRAHFSGAIFTGACLEGANLTGANLASARFEDADLRRANLTGTRMTGATMIGARLNDVDVALSLADLNDVRADLWQVLDHAPSEVDGLLEALRAGRIDGSTYEGDCRCLVGTIASLRGVSFDSLDGIQPDSDRPIERWFLAIRMGHTPETSPIARLTERWILEWRGMERS